MNPNLIMMRVILLVVIVAIAANCLGSVQRVGAMKALLLAETPSRGWIDGGPGQSR
jgi:hypothetical protein